MKALLIINLILNSIYLSVTLWKMQRVPESISETSYMWEDDCSNRWWFHRAYIFSLYCFLTAGLLFYPWVMKTPENAQFLCFLGCVGMIAAGVTPFFKEDYRGYIHYIGGIVAFFCWFTWMLVLGYYWELGVAAIIFSGLTLWKKYAYTYWIEVISIYFLLILLLL